MKFPKVFLACPFDTKMKSLQNELKKLPWQIRAANEKITNNHLLVKIKKNIEECDFAIFDITGWNPNVCLELGLAHGMQMDYYILNNNTIKNEAPSDIKGIERIDYNWNKKKNAANLFNQIKNGIFKKQYLTSKIWKELQHSTRSEDKFQLVIRIFAQFTGAKKNISTKEIKKLARGLNFKKQDDYDEISQILVKNKIFKKTQRSGNLTLIKEIYNK